MSNPLVGQQAGRRVEVLAGGDGNGSAAVNSRARLRVNRQGTRAVVEHDNLSASFGGRQLDPGRGSGRGDHVQDCAQLQGIGSGRAGGGQASGDIAETIAHLLPPADGSGAIGLACWLDDRLPALRRLSIAQAGERLDEGGGAGAPPRVDDVVDVDVGVAGIGRDGDAFCVEGKGFAGLRQASEAIDCGNSGTGIRLLTGLLAGQDFFTVLTGDESIRLSPRPDDCRPAAV